MTRPQRRPAESAVKRTTASSKHRARDASVCEHATSPMARVLSTDSDSEAAGKTDKQPLRERIAGSATRGD